MTANRNHWHAWEDLHVGDSLLVRLPPKDLQTAAKCIGKRLGREFRLQGQLGQRGDLWALVTRIA